MMVVVVLMVMAQVREIHDGMHHDAKASGGEHRLFVVLRTCCELKNVAAVLR